MTDSNQDRLTPEAAIALIEDLVSLYEAGEMDPSAPNGSPIEAAKAILLRCDGALPAGLPAVVTRLLPHADEGRADASSLVAFGRLCGEPWASAMADKARTLLETSPIARAEVDAMMAMTEPEALALAHDILRTPVRREYDLAEPHGCLAETLGFARTVLAMARSRLDGIHQGDIGYLSDKAFTAGQGRLIGRIMSFGLTNRNAEILGDLEPIWSRSAVAPTTAKTMPSQSATIAIGKAVENDPTPAAVATMREVTKIVRHQGVHKKLTRMLGNAGRRLAQRPDLITFLPPSEPIPKSLLGPVRRSLEFLYRSPSEMTVSEWQTRFTSHEHVRSLCEGLIWSIRTPDGQCFSARPQFDDGGLAWRLPDACVAADPDQTIKLWHPAAAAAADRDAWRDSVIATKLAQPFLQAFRQHYRVPDADLDESHTAAFAGHQVALKPFLGAAASEGWRIEAYDGLAFTHDTLLVLVHTDHNLFPGIDAIGMTGSLEAFRQRAHPETPEPIRLRDIDPVLMSEILRSVDLMTSVGAWACDRKASEAALSGAWQTGNPPPAGHRFPPARPGARSADMRRQVLRRLYGSSSEQPYVDGRSLIVGDHAIHIGTGRVTRHGDPVDLDVSAKPKSAIWMPYADEVLARIVRSVDILQGRGL